MYFFVFSAVQLGIEQEFVYLFIFSRVSQEFCVNVIVVWLLSGA